MKTEQELAGKLVKWLKDQHWDVYQEVQMHQGGNIADIVAAQGPLLWVIECKKTMSLELLGQALEWRKYSNFTSVCIPYASRRYSKGRTAAKHLLKSNGIGLIEIREEKTGYKHATDVDVSIRPALRRSISPSLKKSLNEKQKTYARAGNANGRRWTPFQQTCVEINKIVKRRPGITLKDLVDALPQHHYASDKTARSTIGRYAQAETSIIKGVTGRKEGRVIKLYPQEV